MSDDYLFDDEYIDFYPTKARQPGPSEDELAEARALSDKTDACRAMGFKLASWDQRIAVWPDGSYGGIKKEEPERHFRMCPADARWMAPANAEIMTRYQHDLDDVERRWQRDNKPAESSIDKRPYFTDPVPLLFHPEAACRRDDRKDENGIKFKTVWNNRLARLIWMTVGSRYLKSQYFRGHCLGTADRLRAKPPRIVDDLYIAVDGFGCWPELIPYYFRAQLYPYIVRILIHEGRWPYFTPGNLPTRDLGWRYVTPEEHEREKALKKAQMQLGDRARIFR